MKICLASDLHIEINGSPAKKQSPQEEGDLLILAGDITLAKVLNPKITHAQARSIRKATQKMFDKWCSKFRHVIYIAGNHEHYNYIFPETIPTMKTFFKDTNVQVMENESFEMDGIQFLAATLWTDFNGGDYAQMRTIEDRMNDYHIVASKPHDQLTYVERNSPIQRIKYGILRAEETYDVHKNSMKFLDEKLSENPNKKTVIVTHHCPLYACNNIDRHGTIMLSGYCSDLGHFMEKHQQIAYWFCGHTHYKFDFECYKTRVISNPLGYYQEQGYDQFKPMYLEI